MTFKQDQDTTVLSQFEDHPQKIGMYLHAVFNHAGGPMFVKDDMYKLLMVNDAFCLMFGLSRSEIIGKTLVDELLANEFECFLAIDRKVLEEGKEIICEETLTINGMPTKTLLTKKNRFVDPKGNYFLVGIIHDITERKLAEEELELAASVFTHAREGIMVTDANGTIVKVNDTFSRMTGYTPEEVLGKNPKILQSGRQSAEFYVEMWKTIMAQGHWRGEIWNRRKDGVIYPEMLTISAVKNVEGVVQHFVSLCTDITPLKAYQKQLEHNAHYDALTNLPNRVLLADRLSQAMVQCQRRNSSLAVAFMDLDGFKAVNDNHGHDAGDELLITVSQRMKEALREGDTLARIGGDEFIAIMVDLENTEDNGPVLKRLLKAAATPVTVGGIL
ncbi:MAG: PAS domain S-box protein, partial [Paraglaciecola sp.]|nr:PAS domain S-box protein [Paraglaciecola sp.]